VPNSWTDQDATLSNTVCPADCVRWVPSTPPPTRGHSSPLLFGPCVLWPNGCMDQDATWYGCRPRPRPRDVRWDLVPQTRGHSSPPFSAHVYCDHANGWTEVQRYRPQSTRRSVRLPLHRVAQQLLHFSTHFALARSHISAAAEHL